MINFKKIYFHLLLSMISWSVVASQGQALPRFDAPVGIVNEHDCCYVIQSLQLMNAVRHVIPDVFEKVIVNSSHTLLDGYAKTLSNNTYGNPRAYKGFAAQRHLLDPYIFVRAFVEGSSTRSQSLVFEEQCLDDGTMQKINRGPWQKEARFGYTHEVMQLFLEQWSAACKEHDLANPFENTFIMSNGDTRICHWVSLADLCNAGTSGETGTIVVDTSRLLPPQARITQYPQVLIAVNSDKTKSFVLPRALQVNGDDSGNRTIIYKPLAIAYGFPMFSADKGFIGNHGITVVRYGAIWYLCDDDSIMPFINEQTAYNWIAKAHAFTYSGPGLSRDACTGITPHIVIYVGDDL